VEGKGEEMCLVQHPVLRPGAEVVDGKDHLEVNEGAVRQDECRYVSMICSVE
jgi:hypothetical protein